MLQVSLDCPFAIALTGLSNVSFPLVEQGLFFFHSMLSGVPVPQPLALCVVFSGMRVVLCGYCGMRVVLCGYSSFAPPTRALKLA
jgi:hypothetical protein